MKIVPYIQIARPDHWIKNVFVLPGIFLAWFFYPSSCQWERGWSIVLGLAAACLTASSNYVLNEILDAPKDRFHPVKKNRPIACGQVWLPVAWAEWLVLGCLGVSAGWYISAPMGVSCLLFWIMGLLYNLPPVRLKDRPYVDVLSESVNNPLRMVMGWYATGLLSMPTLSILLAYWMFGAFLMATKRFAEYRAIADPGRAAQYRKSFAFYTEERLIESILFYVALFAMFAAIFMTRYKMELILATPLMAFAIAYYLHLGFKADSPVQYPECLYRQVKLMVIVGFTFAACTMLLFVRLPVLTRLLSPWHLPPP
ncbi:MAG: UbiA prenyltransferase family protein [Verrucomicrobiota bacterium]